MPEEVVKLNIQGKVESMRDLCEIIQGIVDETEISWLELKEGVISYEKASEIPPSGDGPIQALKRHLMELEEWFKADPMRRLINLKITAPWEAELVIWIPKLEARES